MKKFPKVLYVFSRRLGEETHMIACESIEEAVGDYNVGEHVPVAAYELKEKLKITTSLNIATRRSSK